MIDAAAFPLAPFVESLTQLNVVVSLYGAKQP